MGNSVELKWSSTDATSCVASGGWSGTKGTSGAEQSAAITSTTSFTLKCDGVAGSATQAVTVNAVTPDKSGGGGGALSWPVLTALGFALVISSRRRRPGAI